MKRFAWILVSALVLMMMATVAHAQSVRILISSDRAPLTTDYDLWTMKEDGSSQTQVTSESGDTRNPSVSRDAREVVYDLSGDLYIKPLSGSGSGQNLTGGTANPCASGDDCYDPDAGPIVNGDGDFQIVFTSDYPYTFSQIWLATVDVSAAALVNLVQLTDLPQAVNYQPAWCGDDHIVFTRSGDEVPYTYEICTLKIKPLGSPICYFTMDDEDPNFKNDTDPSCNPAGTKIAWSKEQGSGGTTYAERDIWTMDFDGSNSMNLIMDGSHKFDDTHPTWRDRHHFRLESSLPRRRRSRSR